MNGAVVRTRLRMLVAVCAVGAVALPAALALGQAKPLELDVPYVPTHPQVVEAMLKLANVTSADYVFDLGCGDGRIVIAAAKDFKARGFGVDLDPRRIRESNQNAKQAGVTDRVKFVLGDALVTDVREATVVTLFLLDSVNLRLRPRLFADLKPGSRVVSHTFTMADWKPDKTIRHRRAYGKDIHFWVMPAPVGGTWRWKTKTADGELAASLKLAQEFQVVSGTVHFAAAADAPISDASLTGKQLRFAATSRIGDKDVKIAYEGTVEGDAIQGTQTWPSETSGGNQPWLARRDPVEITGRWQVRAPQQSDANGALCIRSKDGRLTAAYIRDAEPKTERPLAGFYPWGESVRFEVPSDGTPLLFCGSLAGGAGGGTVRTDADEKGTSWSAKRIADK